MTGTVNDPTAQIRQNLLGLLAGDAELLSGDSVELREHLNADRSRPFLHNRLNSWTDRSCFSPAPPSWA